MNRVTVARDIDVWCNKATSLEKRISDAANDFKSLAITYESTREKSGALEKEKYEAAKERIDTSFANVTETKRYFCELQAGGRRQRKTRRRNNK